MQIDPAERTREATAVGGGSPVEIETFSVGRQALRREVNERIRELDQDWGVDELDVFCECGHRSCTARVVIGRSLYDHVRRTPTHFIVTPSTRRREHSASSPSMATSASSRNDDAGGIEALEVQRRKLRLAGVPRR